MDETEIVPLACFNLGKDTENRTTRSTNRANLIALSQLYQLYFLAQADEIQVFRTSYPEQYFTALLTLKVPKVGYGRGHIDIRNPHFINNVSVGQLGTAEVLIVACDDGDVCIWYTRLLDSWQATIFNQGHIPNPWFTHCLGASAWGISVHTNSRKIAFTSNLHRVHIIALGLEDSEQEYDRENDHIYDLPLVGFNLPCVAFCNTGEDPEGVYLLSGDIFGATFMWNCRTRRMARSWAFHYCTTYPSSQCDCDDSFARVIWNIHWVNPSKFCSSKLQDYHQKTWSMENHTRFGVRNDEMDIWGTKIDSDRTSPNTSETSEDSIELLGFHINDIDSLSPRIVSKIENPPNCPRIIVYEDKIIYDQRGNKADGITIGTGYHYQQRIPHALDRNNRHFNVLNRISQERFLHSVVIEELGLHIVATPVGRCIIYKMFKNGSIFDIKDDKNVEDDQDIMNVRIQAIIPFTEQEAIHQRPCDFLLGMAVAPMPGNFDPQRGQRHWKLILHYRNHTILTYEISRKTSIHMMT